MITINTFWHSKKEASLIRKLKKILTEDASKIKKFIDSKAKFLPQKETNAKLLGSFVNKEKWCEENWRDTGSPLNRSERWHLRALLKSLCSTNYGDSENHCTYIFCVHHRSFNADIYALKGLSEIFCEQTLDFLRENNIKIEYQMEDIHTCEYQSTK